MQPREKHDKNYRHDLDILEKYFKIQRSKILCLKKCKLKGERDSQIIMNQGRRALKKSCQHTNIFDFFLPSFFSNSPPTIVTWQSTKKSVYSLESLGMTSVLALHIFFMASRPRAGFYYHFFCIRILANFYEN